MKKVIAMKSIRRNNARRGAVVPLTAILLIPLLGMLAFAIDTGYIVMSKSELQNAADAAALAAAERMSTYYVEYYLPSANQSAVLTSAQSDACSLASKYASFHKAGGTASVVLDTTNDVKFGYMDSTTPYQSPPPTDYFPNTVEVTLRLDGGASTNPQVNLFFGNVLGMGQVSVTVKARATIYNGDLVDFATSPAAMLPATLDTQIWDSFVSTGKGSLPDFSFTAPTSNAPNTVPSPAISGAPQIQLVPDPNGRPGGWNYLSLDSSSNSNNDFKSWFSTGITQSDLNSLHNGGQLPLPSQPSDPTQATYFWKGAPGDRGNSEPFPPAGAVRILPLYAHVPVSQSGDGNYIANDKNSGQWDGNAGRGQNCWFNIVRFVGVVVTDNSNGLNVQPAAVSAPNATLKNLQAAGPPPSGNQIKTSFAAPKLTY
jgi:Flp pilus assembly protein TadG